MSTSDTKERLLDAAEAGFARQGFAAASLRSITREAGANLAAVHYHFGSKEALYEAVFERRLGPVNRARVARLDELERAAAGRPVPLDQLLRAFVEPALERVRAWGPEASLFLQMSGRMFNEAGQSWLAVSELFVTVRQRFGAAFAAALPHLEPADLSWRLHLMVGAMSHGFCAGSLLTFISNGACRGDDFDELQAQLLAFLEGALGAPAPTRQPAGQENP